MLHDGAITMCRRTECGQSWSRTQSSLSLGYIGQSTSSVDGVVFQVADVVGGKLDLRRVTPQHVVLHGIVHGYLYVRTACAEKNMQVRIHVHVSAACLLVACLHAAEPEQVRVKRIDV
jgi:hypothetical protein